MFHQKKDVWQTLKKNNVAIALHVLFARKEKNISCLCFKAASVSTHNSNRERQVILLITPNGKRCEAKSEGQRRNYVTVKKTINTIKSNDI